MKLPQKYLEIIISENYLEISAKQSDFRAEGVPAIIWDYSNSGNFYEMFDEKSYTTEYVIQVSANFRKHPDLKTTKNIFYGNLVRSRKMQRKEYWLAMSASIPPRASPPWFVICQFAHPQISGCEQHMTVSLFTSQMFRNVLISTSLEIENIVQVVKVEMRRRK